MPYRHGLSKIRVYQSWKRMKQRCLNPNRPDYKYYGGRGIGICNRWLKLENFYMDMGDRPEGYTLERIDNDQGYCPENCVWIPMEEQAWNKRAKGYCYHKDNKKWQARIRRFGKIYSLGCYDTEEEASETYWRIRRILKEWSNSPVVLYAFVE